MNSVSSIFGDSVNQMLGIHIEDFAKETGSMNIGGIEVQWKGNHYKMTSPALDGHTIRATCQQDGTVQIKMDKSLQHKVDHLHGHEKKELDKKIETLKQGVLDFHNGRKELKGVLPAQKAPEMAKNDQFHCTTEVKKKHGAMKVIAKGIYNGQNGKLVLKKKHGEAKVDSTLDKTSELYKRLKAEAEKVAK